MCNIPLEEKKKEAMRRMRKLNYFGPSRKAFYDRGSVMINEPPYGAHFFVDEDKELVEKIQEVQKRDNSLVYAVVRTFYKEGHMDSLLYVEDEKDEWGYFDEDFPNGVIFAYVFNRFDPACSEYGSIGITYNTPAGGIIRYS